MQTAKLAIFMPSLRGGGAERVVVNLISEMINYCEDIDLVLVRAEGPYLHQVPESVRIVNLGSSSVFLSLPKLVCYLRRERPKFLLSIMDHCNIVALVARLLSCVPVKVLISIHNTLSRATLYEKNVRGKLIPVLARVLYRYADKIIAVSQGVADDLRRVFKTELTNLTVIYNPVIMPELFKMAVSSEGNQHIISSNDKIVLGVGRLSHAKDFKTLIRAFHVVSHHADAKLIILGEGEERPFLEDLIRELRLADKVFLAGFTKNPYSIMKAASVFVLSSIYEGLPTVLIEALALELPVVSTDCESGPKEILESAGVGVLVKIGDIKGMADAILASLNGENTPCTDSDKWKIFTVEHATKRYLELFA